MLNKATERVHRKSGDKLMRAELRFWFWLLSVFASVANLPWQQGRNQIQVFRQMKESHLYLQEIRTMHSITIRWLCELERSRVLDVGGAAQGRVKHTLNRLQMKSLNTHSLPSPPLLCLSSTESLFDCLALSFIVVCCFLNSRCRSSNTLVPLKWLLLTTDL